MNAELREAVEAVERSLEANYTTGASVHRCMATIAQALRDQEAEIAGYRLEEQRRIAEAVALASRVERAEVLLRECQQFLSTYHPADQRLSARITAHLGGENNG